MNHSARSTTLRRFISISLVALGSLAAASSVVAQQQQPPTYPPARFDPSTTPATYVDPASPATSPLTSPPPQLLTPPNENAASVPVPITEPAPAVGLTPRDAKGPKKLALPGSNRDDAAARSGVAGVFSVLASLGVVLGLFFAAAYLMRRGLPKQGRVLPREAVESLGRIPFPGRQQGQLIRVGNKLVLVSFSSAGADVITEITDPLEVDRLAGMCAQADRNSSVKTFRDVVDQFFGEKTKRPEPPNRAESRAAAAQRAALARFKENDHA